MAIQEGCEGLIGQKHKVLDHGHIILQDVMGCDADIAQAARTSYQKGTKTVNDDRGLLRRLMRDRHTSPLEMGEVKFHVKLPIFVERQWVRHRMASMNEVSARYSQLPEEYYIPEKRDIAAQSKINKQGRDEPIEEGVATAFQHDVSHACHQSFAVYHKALENGVARELARIELPLGTYTEKVWKCDLHNLFHFLGLRMDKHAQWEVRQYANVIGGIVSQLFPICWQAFLDFRLNAKTFSSLDLRQIQRILSVGGLLPMDEQRFFEFCLIDEWDASSKNSERDEFIVKAKSLGLIA
jgi:thymidylate synthase (FAD)